jgi:hypothetical protein
MGFVSCQDQLDIPQQGVLPAATYYAAADDATVTSFISAVYYEIHGNIGSPTGQIGVLNSGIKIRDLMEKIGGDFTDDFLYIESASGSTYSYIWSYYYSIIYWCNMIIEKIPENNAASASVKNQVIAEARAIRAIMMMHLVQLYGNPPLADHVMDGSESNTPAAESWAFINSELARAAEEGLPSKAGKGRQSAIGGRLTKEAAYAYLGKAYLWQKNYADAAKTLHDKVIATNLYELNPEFNELNRYTADFCDEYLWEYEITNQGDYSTAQAGRMDAAYINWSSMLPCEEIFTEGWGYTAFPSESFGSFMDVHDVVSGTKSKRYQGMLATYEEVLNSFTWTGNAGIKEPLQACEGYFRLKMIPRTENLMGASSWFYTYMHNNLCYMRYAEVLLNYAEAVSMGGANGTSLSGLQALNLVRQRAGLTDAPSLNMDDADYGIKAERRAELNWEGVRFIDLVRWGDAPVALADAGKYLTFFDGYKDGTSTTPQSKAEWKITKTRLTGDGFKAGQHELFPIPTVERNSNPNLEQNPGW